MFALATAGTALALAAGVSAQKANTWAVVGESGVSAQQLFRGQGNKVYILDKVENNPIQINGHPAWATEYDTTTNTYRIQDVRTNTFCAGGNVLGNGTWAIFGGNKAVQWGGREEPIPGSEPYGNYNGGTAIRLIDPCTDEQCQYTTSAQAAMQGERWYPMVETLQDGSLIIIGGMRDGGYVNARYADEPTIEYFPSKGDKIGLNILAESLPCNLYALTWLLPSGNLLIQSNWKAEIFDWQNNVEHPLPDMLHAVRVYPASAATAMLPLTPANNWTATILFCGGTNLQADQWMTSPNWDVTHVPTDDTCVSITPDVSPEWKDEDKLFEGRTMGQFVILPTGKLFHTNGMHQGTAGYGNITAAVGQSYSDDPLMQPSYYDHGAPSGKRWQRPPGMGPMTVVRSYHSAATLMADGSVFVAGSNPNYDYIPYKGFVDEVGRTYSYPTEYRVEVFYPDYYDKPRPQPKGLPTSLSYGGPSFDIQLSKSDLKDNVTLVDTAEVVVLRTGYSTHGMNFGQRLVQLSTSFTANSDGSAVLHSAQMPPNPSIMAPGPALLFVVIDGVPSVGVDVMVGNGQLGPQPIQAVADLPGTRTGSGQTVTPPTPGSNSNAQNPSVGSSGVAPANSPGGDNGAATASVMVSLATLSAAILLAGFTVSA